ncbi:hypothetical protein BU17DRAFT_71750 [Hysterangium stoloniferum]|nr:hypothetical protein BU17DRAFT_71750 [Hysterangium stoloniferum]
MILNIEMLLLPLKLRLTSKSELKSGSKSGSNSQPIPKPSSTPISTQKRGPSPNPNPYPCPSDAFLVRQGVFIFAVAVFILAVCYQSSMKKLHHVTTRRTSPEDGQRQDREVLELEGVQSGAKKFDLAFAITLLSQIAETANPPLLPGLTDRVYSRKCIVENDELFDLLGECLQKGSFSEIRSLEMFQPFVEAKYVSDPLQAFELYTRDCFERFLTAHQDNKAYYGLYLSIVQSSGTGKSRLISELGKNDVFVVHMTLRDITDKGFPPRDDIPANLLSAENAKDSMQYESHCSAFFTLEFTPCLNTSWPFFPFMHDSIHLIFTPGAQSCCSLTSYGPGAPPLSLQGPYDVMLSVTSRLNTSWPVFPFMYDCIYLIFTPGAKSGCSLTSYGPGAPPLSLQGPYDVMLSVTFRRNTSRPFFPFMHDCIYLIFTPGAKSRCSLTSYGPGAPPLSLQGPYDIMLSVTFRLNTSWPFFPLMHDSIHLIFTPGTQSWPFWHLLPASTLVGRSSHSCMTAFISFSPLVQNHALSLSPPFSSSTITTSSTMQPTQDSIVTPSDIKMELVRLMSKRLIHTLQLGLEAFWACGWEVPGYMSCAESSSGTHHHYQESPAEASTSSSLQDRATPMSPSSTLESPLSPYSRQSPHNHPDVCVPNPDSHNSGSQGHNPPTPTLSPSPVFSIQPSLSQLRSTSLRDHNTILHMAAPTLDPHGMGLYSEDHEESPRSPMSPLSTHNHLALSYNARFCRATLLLRGRHSGLYDPPMESDESAPILSPLRMNSHPQALGSQPLQWSLPFTSPLTRPQAVDEPRKVTLPSFAETFPEFVGSSLRVGGHVILYPR